MLVPYSGEDRGVLPPLLGLSAANRPTPNPRIVLATDDANYARRVVQRYGASVVRQQRGGEYLVRDSRGGAMWKMRTKLYRAHLMGVQVLLDTLLLSRCDYLLKAASAVSEFAIYFSPRLINNSFDFQIPSPNHPRVGDRMYLRPSLPEWAARLGWSNLSVLDADQQPLQLPPKYRDGPLADEAWTDGFCGVTKVGRSAEEDCDERDRGAVPLRRLPPPHDQQACVEFCLHRCRRCGYVSVSHELGDCSWYQTCALDALERRLNGKGPTLPYVTRRVGVRVLHAAQRRQRNAPRSNRDV